MKEKIKRSMTCDPNVPKDFNFENHNLKYDLTNRLNKKLAERDRKNK